MNRPPEDRSPVVHYGTPGWASSCGVRYPHRVNSTQGMVTCLKCKGTLHWRSRFHDHIKEK